jgi:hypothetical protein
MPSKIWKENDAAPNTKETPSYTMADSCCRIRLADRNETLKAFHTQFKFPSQKVCRLVGSRSRNRQQFGASDQAVPLHLWWQSPCNSGQVKHSHEPGSAIMVHAMIPYMNTHVSHGVTVESAAPETMQLDAIFDSNSILLVESIQIRSDSAFSSDGCVSDLRSPSSAEADRASQLCRLS